MLPTSGSIVEAYKNTAVDGLLASTYNNMMQDAMAVHVKESRDAQQAFKTVYDAVDV